MIALVRDGTQSNAFYNHTTTLTSPLDTYKLIPSFQSNRHINMFANMVDEEMIMWNIMYSSYRAHFDACWNNVTDLHASVETSAEWMQRAVVAPAARDPEALVTPVLENMRLQFASDRMHYVLMWFADCQNTYFTTAQIDRLARIYHCKPAGFFDKENIEGIAHALNTSVRTLRIWLSQQQRIQDLRYILSQTGRPVPPAFAS